MTALMEIVVLMVASRRGWSSCAIRGGGAGSSPADLLTLLSRHLADLPDLLARVRALRAEARV